MTDGREMPVVERLFRWIGEFRRAGLVRLAFGEPIQEGNRTVVPVGDVSLRQWVAVHPEQPDIDFQLPGPTDGVVFQPVAEIEVRDDGVRLMPTGTKLGVSFLLGAAAGLAATLGWWLARDRRT